MSRYKCVQRVVVSEQTSMEDILDSIDRYPGAWDSVMLFIPTDFNDSAEERAMKCQELANQIDTLKKRGIPVEINLIGGLGHGDFQSKKQSVPRRMVGPEGETCIVSVCPRSEELKVRLAEMHSYIAQFHPESMWLDDDFRVYDHEPVQCACFCDSCIAEFNEKYHHNFTREELNREILTDHFPQDNPIRREWLHFNHQSMVELLEVVEKAIHSVDPDIVIGLMEAGAEYNIYDQSNFKDYARALVNRNGKVYFRPGAWFYNDQTPFGAVLKAFGNAVTNEHSLIEGAEAYAESVICPYMKRGKSHKINAWEAALEIGLGGNAGVQYEAIQNMLAEMNGYIRYMDQQRPFLAELSESLKGHKQIGFYPYFSEDQWVYANSVEHMREMHDFPFNLSRQLLKIGVPLTPSAENALAVILAGNLVKAMPEEELQMWLGKAVYADAEAASYVDQKLGYHALGVKIMGPVSDNGERFTDDELNVPYKGFIRGGHWGGYGNGCADMTCEGARALSYTDYPSENGDFHSVGSAVYETPEGGKAAVLAHAPWSDDIMSFPKSNQILNILDWLCDRMPVRIQTDCRIGQALWQGKTSANEKEELICFLFSMDYDVAENVCLKLKTPAKAERLGYDGIWREIGEGSEIIVDQIDAFTCAPIRLK